MRKFLLGLLLLIPVAASAADEVTVAPRKSAGEIAYYPKLVNFPDPQVRDRVNKLLAGYGLQQSQDRKDCYKQLQDQGQQKDKDSFYTSIEVTHVSRRFLSINVNQNTDCGGAHPSSGASPVTLDLTHGTEVDWKTMFKPGFLSATDPKTFDTRQGKLAALYRAHYAKIRKGDKDCLDAIHDENFLDVVLWLDKNGLTANPQLPHVTQACDEDVAFSPAELAPYIADPNLLAELQAMPAKK